MFLEFLGPDYYLGPKNLYNSIIKKMKHLKIKYKK